MPVFQLTGFTLQPFRRDVCILLADPSDGFSAICELVPSATLFGWDVRPWRFIEAPISIVGVTFDDAVFRPPDQGTFRDPEFRAGFRLCQHPTGAQSVVASAQTILFDEVDDAQVGKLCRLLDVSCGFEDVAEGCGNEVNHGDEGMGVSVAPCPGASSLEDTVERLHASVAVG